MRQLKISKQITNRDSLSFGKYLTEVSQIKGPLTPEEETNLAERIKKGDKKAEDELVLRNLRFVISVAKQYQGYEVQIGDLVKEGNYGLIKAARKFDATMGNKFISYAVWWVRQTILQYLSEHSRSIRLPLNRVTQLNKIKKTQMILEQELAREPEVDEIFERLEGKVKMEDIESVLLMDKSVRSLDADNNRDSKDGDDFRLKDILQDPNQEDTDAKMLLNDQKFEVSRVVKKLSPIYQTVIIQYYGLDRKGERTLEEISQEIGLTRERVRQIKNDAIIRMANLIKNKVPMKAFKKPKKK
jgi:RNA polymerase primary sigma factor